jgi:phosphoglycerate dehydrogenase-like enzyme
MMMTEAAEKIKVVVAMDFSDEILDRLRQVSPRLDVIRCFPDVTDAIWADTEVLYTMNVLPDPAQAPRLRWIQFHSAGIEKFIDHPIVQAEDVEVTNTSGMHATQMAEYCLGMMLAFAYKLPDMLRFQAKAYWPERPHQVFKPVGLRGATVGIAGYGSVGRELARMADALGMIVLATKRDVMHPEDETGYIEEGTGDPEGVIPERLYPAGALVSMAKDCDFLVVTTPLTADTRRSVNEEVFSAMKNTAFLINVARGGVVDEAAMISTLAAGKIAGAALDVFEEEPLPPTNPLWNLDNVILSPHVSGNHARYHEKAAALFAENLRRYVEKRPLLNLLDRSRGY